MIPLFVYDGVYILFASSVPFMGNFPDHECASRCSFLHKLMSLYYRFSDHTTKYRNNFSTDRNLYIHLHSSADFVSLSMMFYLVLK